MVGTFCTFCSPPERHTSGSGDDGGQNSWHQRAVPMTQNLAGLPFFRRGSVSRELKERSKLSQCAFDLTAFRGIVKIVLERSSRFGLVQYTPYGDTSQPKLCLRFQLVS